MIQKKTVLVVGSLNMDLVATAARLPERGETVFGSQFATFPGGKGANQAAAAGRLGADVKMVGCVGQDAFGAELIKSMAGSGVDTARIRQVATATGTALITVGADGANTIVVIGGANECCSAKDAEQAIREIGSEGILLLQHEVPPVTVEAAIRAAKRAGWTVILNPAPVRAIDAELLPLIDILLPNETEMAVLAGRPTATPDEAANAATELLEAGVGALIITLGSQGALYRSKTATKHIPAYKVQAVDTTAAGDAYAGALTAYLAEGQPLETAMQRAAAAAALSVTKQGAQPSLAWRDEVEQFLQREGQ